MRLNGTDWDQPSLHALGAKVIGEARDQQGAVIGLDVSPDLPLDSAGKPKGYDTAKVAAAGRALIVYAEAKHALVLNGGIKVDVGGGTTADVASDPSGRGLVTGCVGLADLAAEANAPAPTFPWVNNDGAKLTLSVAQIKTIALALGQHVQAAYGTLGDVVAAIGKGAITDQAGIDAAAWPSNG